MMHLPRYAETRRGELPDAYFVDGARLTPISRIVDSAEAQAPEALAVLDRAAAVVSQIPDGLAALDRAVAAVAAVENGLPRQPNRPAVEPDVLRGAREASAALAKWRLDGGHHVACIESAEARRSPALATFSRGQDERER